ncbi:hypothetical protein C8A05DRAFT_41522 [Staphylotrichum tortipilum]|uniref:NAD(P)-binding protein n=1 Tax=Staphylotrichum tortipilum TaxID=2831512 RepID=A0AAN6MR46_9PEZI|nr:hypothetical protein C8A05DRAFT_41522 [Staphylotrichum longicolle]
MPSIGDFIHAQFVLKIPPPTASFASKTVLVTGANGGLGQEIVKHVIRLGANKVIFACRSRSRGGTAKEQIEALLKCNPAIIEVWEVDLESPTSIKYFVDRVNTSLPRLDVVINNAGIHLRDFSIVYDTEYTLAINTIGTFLLSVQLIPKLRETARTFGVTPHMTMVGSALYDVAKYPENHGRDIFAWFRDKAHFTGMNQYNLSKLLLLFATIQLSALVDPPNTPNPHPIVINSLDPCFCKTGLGGEVRGPVAPILKLFRAIAGRPAHEGAALVVKAAAAGRETHGRYMRCGEVREYDPIVRDENRGAYVWRVLGERLEGLQPGVLRVLE